jgi:hypothetical protein
MGDFSRERGPGSGHVSTSQDRRSSFSGAVDYLSALNQTDGKNSKALNSECLDKQ